MFGLMTVAEHERLMAAQREAYRVAEERAVALWQARVTDARAESSRDAGEWRELAHRLTADLVAIRKAEAPAPVPPVDPDATSSVNDADADWTPSALAERAKRAGIAS